MPMEFFAHLFNISIVSDDLTVVLVGPDEVEAGDVWTQAAELVVIRAVAEATKFIIMFFCEKIKLEIFVSQVLGCFHTFHLLNYCDCVN